MARPKKIKVSEFAQEQPIIEASSVLEITEVQEVVKPIKTNKQPIQTEVNKVKLRHIVSGKIIALAVDEAIANKLVKTNPNIEIVR